MTGLQPDSAAVADRLTPDVNELQGRVKTVQLTPVQLANGAKELLDEVATGKITGEEDRNSHTDLYDFRGNVDGSQAAISALRPVLDQHDPALGQALDLRFADVDRLLERYRAGDGSRHRAHARRHQEDDRGDRRPERTGQSGARSHRGMTAGDGPDDESSDGPAPARPWSVPVPRAGI